MKRRQRTEILIEGSPQLAERLAGEIRGKYEYSVIQPPERGLAMINMRETAQRSLFYAGEVLVTECKVMLGETIGLGIVRGHRPELAEQLAVIDAAYAAQLPEVAGWTPMLEQEGEALHKKRWLEWQGVLRTKVSFETMQVEGE